MSYELFRNDFIEKLANNFTEEQMDSILYCMDQASVMYDFARKEVSLSVYGGIPDVVKLYITARATENLKKGTLVNYYNLLKNFFLLVRKPYDEINSTDIRLFLQNYQLMKKHSDRTKNQNKVYLNAFFTWLYNENMINRNPVSSLKPIKYHEGKRYSLSVLEAEKMRYACKTLRERVIFDILYSSGVRVSELCDLLRSDVNIENRSVRIRHGKGDKERMTYINPVAALSLQSYLASRTDDSPYLIVNERGKEKSKITKRTIENEIKKISERAGLINKNIRPHNLRHTFASVMIKNGCPVEMVQQLLGHSKISTTMIYTHLDQEDVRRSYERYAV